MRGAAELAERLGRIADRVDSSELTDRIASALQAQARHNATHRPGPMVRTGALVRSIHRYPATRVGPAAFNAIVGPTVVYGRIQELGGHIYPKHLREEIRVKVTDRGRLSIRRVMVGWLSWESGGTRFFAKHVHLPARPYLRPAILEVQRQIPSICDEWWKEVLR